MEKTEKKKKISLPVLIINIIVTAIFVFVFICLCTVMIQTVTGKEPTLFGYRSFVVLTFGSIFLHRSSSQVVSVICTTHFVFRLMACKKSRSRNTRSDLVIKVKPKP